ncbi:hypothetical protein D9M69_470930 [compost metagenome]
MLDQLLSLGGLGLLRGCLLRWGDLTKVASQGFLKCHALGATALDVDTAHHFIFGAARPVLGVALGSETLCSGGPAGFADNRFPRTGISFDDGGHQNTVPKLGWGSGCAE